MQTDAGRLLHGLDGDQLPCVTAPPGPIAVVARAGSGKTRVLTRRIAYRAANGDLDPSKTLVLTFTRKAAEDLRQRLGQEHVQDVAAGTFHAVGYKLVELHREHVGGTRRTITGNPLRLMTDACQKLPVRPADVLEHLERRTALDTADSDDHHAQGLAEPLVEAIERYRQLKRRRGILDFGDLLTAPIQLIESDPVFRAVVAWRFCHVLVDEAQDMTPLQWRFVKTIVGDSVDLFLVGDPSQSIYGWQQADPAILTETLARDFPGVQRFELPTNYRSAPSVVRIADTVLRPTEPTRYNRDDEGQVLVREFASVAEEAEAIAWEIRRLRAAGMGWTEIAVLARTNDRLSAIHSCLAKRGIPTRGGQFLRQLFVRSCLEAFQFSGPEIAAASCVTVMREIVQEKLDDLQADHVRLGNEDSDDEVGDLPELSQARAAGVKLVALTGEWAAEYPGNTKSFFLDYLNGALRSRGGNPDEGSPGVEVLTFHRAKGLEWRHVFVVGLEDDLMPLVHSADTGEERRLLYVALTRATLSVQVSWCRSRADMAATGPSRYLDRIKRAADTTIATPEPSASESVAAIRSLLNAGVGS